MKSKQPFDLGDKRSLLMAAVVLLLLVLLPLLVANQFSAKDRHYTKLVYLHECVRQICAVDFDADGTLGRVFIDRSNPRAPQEYWLIAKENGKELLRLPYWELDETARTHAAITQSEVSSKTRLVVYEHKGRDAPIIQAVYEWNGNQMIQTPHSESEKELFKAIATRDQNGTFNYWALYRIARVPLLVGYYLLLFVVVSVIILKVDRGLSSR